MSVREELRAFFAEQQATAEGAYARTPAAFDTRPGGEAPVPLAPRKSKAVAFTENLIRTIVFVGLFLLVCKLTHFRTKILYDPRINRKFLKAFYGSCALWSILYTYMVLTLRVMRPKAKKVPVDDWDKVAPIPLYAASASLALAVITFIFALWPCFKLATFAIGTLGLMALLFAGGWIPI
jgi:hypothetical protein